MIILSSCNSPEKKVENAQEDLIHAKKELDQSKNNIEKARLEYDSAKKEWEETISSNEKNISELQTKMNKVKKDVQVVYLASLSVLEKKNTDLKNKLEEYKMDSDEQWRTFEKEFNHDITELLKQIIDFQTKNK